ncbi:Hypothetical protein PHPALM_19277 [Phytophthora palmivora]|uniref:Uncharacterized protein n=1 Tax=Phytophthora palmivora TaxID=4796 RepID=A0A2P4XHQ4_9STRA|nr:Hypothetical protein PHPALM_19277 [Phytophthora palmivora]
MALLHSCAVYLYVYDNDSGSYTQQTDAAVGCALLAGEHAAQSGSDAFSLLFYDTQKSPLLQLPLTPSARFVPQKDNYVNFYDRQTQRNYAMRFKDGATSESFVSAVAWVKAQVFVHANKAYERHKPAVLVEQLSLGKEDAAPLTFGDVAGVTLKKWQGSVEQREKFFSANPLEIKKQPTVEATSGSEVRRIKLVEEGKEEDPFIRILATEALIGMQKMGKRLVTVTFPDTNEWAIAELELVKVKKNTKSSIHAETETQAAVTDEGHEELVKRMASLSHMGSQSSELLASVKTKLDSRATELSDEIDTSLTRSSSLGQQSADPPAGYVPVLLAGLQLPGERPGSFRNLQNEVQASVQSETVSPPHTASLAAKVIEPLKHSSEPASVDTSGMGLLGLVDGS